MNNRRNIPLLVLSDPASRQLPALERVKDRADVTIGLSSDEVLNAAARAEVLLYWHSPARLVEDILPHCTNLRWLHSKSAGIEDILSPALRSSDLVLTNSRGVYARSLAEFALGGMLFFAKDFPRMSSNKTVKQWRQFEVEELAGKTLGVYGYGEIGRAVARLAKCFGMRVITARRNPGKSDGDPQVDLTYSTADRAKLCGDCDYLLISAPLTAETRGAIGEHELDMLRPSAVLINIGRGAVVDESALIRCLQAGKIKGAVLDVFEEEPLPSENPLWALPNVLLSPHTADQTATWKDESMDFFIGNFSRYAAGEPLMNICDKLAGY